jgi:hypothetical protein
MVHLTSSFRLIQFIDLESSDEVINLLELRIKWCWMNMWPTTELPTQSFLFDLVLSWNQFKNTKLSLPAKNTEVNPAGRFSNQYQFNLSLSSLIEILFFNSNKSF